MAGVTKYVHRGAGSNISCVDSIRLLDHHLSNCVAGALDTG